jgi:hypothetical protein
MAATFNSNKSNEEKSAAFTRGATKKSVWHAGV